ncbi:lantibiotic dehydratase family protein [Chryseobacterium gleum]|uniref:lantibiotic dehydratase family protein n=1 Tax=Chryseobacterium gleum TaxID=250 RepID=UPI001E3C80F2|nr:lantibiotic dehydratase family protein [Chryseobacterium gleum]MCE4065301.1 lantibiotic dehydratase family protein [Chryseobacterium gleum]
MSKFPYKILNQYVLRTPSKPINIITNLLKEREVSDEALKALSEDPLFKEALFLASPLLHDMLINWLTGTLNKEKEEKVKMSLLKYISRMSSRCTPFGLFAGYSLGRLSEENNIEIAEENKYKRYTRLDMQYLLSLSQSISSNKKIRAYLTYHWNTSIYKAGGQYRYVEYTYTGGLRRVHHIEAVEITPHLEYLLNNISQNNSIQNIVDSLIQYDPEITDREAKNFIHELIDNQLLISNIGGSSIGEDYLSALNKVLSTIKGNLYNQILNDISFDLIQVDNAIPNDIDIYHSIHKKTAQLGIQSDLKFLFQTDLSVTTKNNTLNKNIIKDLQEGLMILNNISSASQKNTNSLLEKFIAKFKKRYEGREIPLSIALDNEIGIGYTSNHHIIPGNHFLEKIHIPLPQKKKEEIQWDAVSSLFHNKIMEAYKNQSRTICLTSTDIPIQENALWNDFADTFSLMTEMIYIDNQQKILFHGFSGASGANLFGRFCSSDPLLKEHAEAIINIEKEINKNSIIAEISHIPEARIGNVICRPSFTEYEIPYLSRSEKNENFQINIQDLMISVRNNKILLRSKKLDKFIIPRLHTAHNFSSNSLPVYHFLCDLQNQENRFGLSLHLGQMEKKYKYIPRIEYKNIILKPAVWNLNIKDLPLLSQKKSSGEELLKLMNCSREEWHLPQYVLLTEYDNELLINLENISSIKMMIDVIGKKENFTLKEFLYTDEHQLVKRDQDFFTNQFIFTFYNNQKLYSIKNEK